MPRVIVLAIVGLLAHGAGLLEAAHWGLEHAPGASRATACGSACCPSEAPQPAGPTSPDRPDPDPTHGCGTCELLATLQISTVDLAPPAAPTGFPPAGDAVKPEAAAPRRAELPAAPARGPPAFC